MKCFIDGNEDNFTSDDISAYHGSDKLAYLRIGKREYVVAEDSEVAGEMAREYWEDMAKNDPREFSCIIGEKTLISWGMGQFAGPGSTHVSSLSDWLDLWLDTPEEHFASYDGNENTIEFEFSNPSKKDTKEKLNDYLEEIFGFVPTVAYRSN